MSVTARLGAKPCFLSSLRISLIASIPARLDQQVKDFGLLVDGTPQAHAPAGDPHDHLVEVPSVARPRPPLPEASREERAEFEHATADRFIGQVEPAFGKQFLDVAVAQSEADIEANCVL